MSGSLFAQCFCFNTNTEKMCDPHWNFVDQAPCRKWLTINGVGMIVIFVISWVFFVATFICALTSKKRCACLVSNTVTRGSVRNSKIFVVLAALGCASLVSAMIATSVAWGNNSVTTVDSAKSLVNDNLDMNDAAASDIIAIDQSTDNSSYINAALDSKLYSLTGRPTKFVSKALVDDAKTARKNVRNARSWTSDLFHSIHEVFANKYYGRPAATLWLTAVCALMLAFIVLLTLCGGTDTLDEVVTKRRRLGYVTGIFAFGCYLLIGFIVSISIASAGISGDLCAVYDDTFAPAVVYVAKDGSICGRDAVANGASNSTQNFAEFVTWSNLIVNPSPCNDAHALCLLGELSKQQTVSCLSMPGCRADMNKDFPSGNAPGTSVSVRNIYSWGDLVNLQLFPEGKDVRTCATKCITQDARDAAKRLVAFTDEIWSPLYNFSQVTFPKDFNCSQFRGDLGKLKHPLCDLFAKSALKFSAAGGAFILIALLVLWAVRWVVGHTAAEDDDGDDDTKSQASLATQNQHQERLINAAHDTDDANA